MKREEYDSRADIWSLGCVIFMICNNDTPFYAHSESKLIQKICYSQHKQINTKMP